MFPKCRIAYIELHAAMHIRVCFQFMVLGRCLDGISHDYPTIAKLPSLFLFQFHRRHPIRAGIACSHAYSSISYCIYRIACSHVYTRMFSVHGVGTGLDGVSHDYPPVAKLRSLFLFQLHRRHSSLSWLLEVFTGSLL